MTSRPSVLICLPTMHRLGGLKRAVASVMAQTFADWECWIVEDGCLRGPECLDCPATEAYVAELCARDARFRFAKLDYHDGGAGSGNRNAALRLAAPTEFVAYLDDDNWWEPEHLQALHESIRANDAAFAFAGSRVWVVDKAKRERLFAIRGARRKLYLTGIDTNELFHRRELIARYGEWKHFEHPDVPHHGNDWELVRRWLRGGERGVYSGAVTVNYCLSPKLPVWRHRINYWRGRIKDLFREKIPVS